MERKVYSQERLNALARGLSDCLLKDEFSDVCVYATGSFARGEASEHSDLDLFFVRRKESNWSRIRDARFFAKIVDQQVSLGFPEFSNDGQYLSMFVYEDILEEIGGQSDDYLNYFTARMLMLLESKPIFNFKMYDEVIAEFVKSYFRDFPDHDKDFRPVFLINDILRFWRTLCLNYEKKRNSGSRRTKERIRNFKLKFSRMLTCFGTVIYLVDSQGNVNSDKVVKMTRLSPIERLTCVTSKYNDLQQTQERIMEEYKWFLRCTQMSAADFENWFEDREERTKAFGKAEKFGDAVYEALIRVADEKGFVRHLMI